MLAQEPGHRATSTGCQVQRPSARGASGSASSTRPIRSSPKARARRASCQRSRETPIRLGDEQGQLLAYYIFPHGMLDPWFRRSYPIKHLKKQLYWILAERQVLEQARAVLFTSEREARLAEMTFLPKGNYRRRIIPLGVPPGTVRDRNVARRVSAKIPTSANPSVSLVPGTVTSEKRL